MYLTCRPGETQGHDDVIILMPFLHNWPFVSKSACHLGIQLPIVKASNAKLAYYRCCYSQQAAEQTVELPVIWYTMTLMWHHCNETTVLENNWNPFMFKIPKLKLLSYGRIKSQFCTRYDCRVPLSELGYLHGQSILDLYHPCQTNFNDGSKPKSSVQSLCNLIIYLYHISHCL